MNKLDLLNFTKEKLKTKLSYKNENEIEYSKDFEQGFVLYPCDLKLERKDWEILKKIWENLGETKILIRLIHEGIDKISEEGSYVFSPNISYEEYVNISNLPFEKIIYSEKLNWLIYINIDFYGEIRGKEEIIQIFKKYFSDWKKMAIEFQKFEIEYVEEFKMTKSEKKIFLLNEAKRLWSAEKEMSEYDKYHLIHEKYKEY